MGFLVRYGEAQQRWAETLRWAQQHGFSRLISIIQGQDAYLVSDAGLDKLGDAAVVVCRLRESASRRGRISARSRGAESLPTAFTVVRAVLARGRGKA